MTETAQALIYTGPGEAQLRPVTLAEGCDEMAEVRTLYSGISRGTERLVSAGLVPPAEYARMRAPLQEGDFPFPVKYGYAAVGLVEAGPAALVGREVFCLHPHQDRFRVSPEWLVPLPPGVPAARAILAANAETALNAIWDARIAPGERVLVMGAGLLGCLIAAFLGRLHGDDLGAPVDVADKLSEPGAALAEFPVNFLLSGVTGHGADSPAIDSVYDVVFHTTASGAGLQASLDALAFEGRVIELSWYGDRPVELRLGGAFHSRRLSICSSQVGHVSPARRATTSHRQRLAEALALLDDPRLDRLITEEVAFKDLPVEIPRLLALGAPGIATRIRY